jgi:hypothetical protein
MAKTKPARRPVARWGGGRPKPRPEHRQRAQIPKGNGHGRAKNRTRPGRRGRRSLTRPSPALFGIAAVVLVVVGLVVWSVASPGKSGVAGGLAPADVVQRTTAVPASVLQAVGPGEGLRPPQRLPAGTAPLTKGGLPGIVYVGADYCPFCAVQRWSLVVALGRFGTFENLGATSSASNDIYPNTKTFSFHGSTYTSQYLTFTAVETATRDGTPLDSVPADVGQLLSAYDALPFVAQGHEGAYPFIDIANRFVVIGATGDVRVLQGLTMEQIAAQLSDAASAVAKSVGGAANLFTAAICETTGNVPADVCTSPVVQQAQRLLAAS